MRRPLTFPLHPSKTSDRCLFFLPISISVSSAEISYHFFPFQYASYCILLFSYFLNVSWSFSHILVSVSNPKDNYVWLILWESKPSTHKAPSLRWKSKKPKKQKSTSVQQGFFFFFFNFRKFGEFPSSEREKRNNKISRYVPFQKASAHS